MEENKVSETCSNIKTPSVGNNSMTGHIKPSSWKQNRGTWITDTQDPGRREEGSMRQEGAGDAVKRYRCRA